MSTLTRSSSVEATVTSLSKNLNKGLVIAYAVLISNSSCPGSNANIFSKRTCNSEIQLCLSP
jgi:hypothetical protein